MFTKKQAMDCDTQLASTCPLLCRRAIVTRKVGQTDLVNGVRSRFPSSSVHARLWLSDRQVSTHTYTDSI